MASGSDALDVIVVGAGWAGLGVSYYLSRAGLRHRVLERGRIGETWRTQRWDSFRMNLPNIQTVMPGDRYDGPDPEGALTRDEFVALLDDFAERNRLPVEGDSEVTELAPGPVAGIYRLVTERGTLEARNVVIASGNLNRPVRPTWTVDLPRNLTQIDTSDYRNASAIPPGAVLVVGSGQSGGQIAEDLVRAGRQVFLATSQVGRARRRYRGRDIMIWLVQSGMFDVPRKDFVQPSGRIAPRPLFGAQHTISLQSLSAQGVVLLGRIDGIESDGRLSIADDVEDNIRFADEMSTKMQRQIDDYIARTGSNAPPAEPDPAENAALRLPRPTIRSLDLAERGITTVIWCTGFQGDFTWIRLPDVLDARRQPLHEGGITKQPGIYFAGMDLAVTRKSGTVLAVQDESARLVEYITRHDSVSAQGRQ
ncbi:NAD(P)-binding domain-containing protein [Bradyrhizobium jicamae]|uniref:flavin-containing monooxygenase n=1 Tax=Bradyrhizobium jicamae TaxID=280332 RepID=UPI001BAE128E|nr:NAD(P)/FAD-dependent oxidoreductase [Bradyrhizobium jicamae]MBR0755401.1 NAD(P)-binding domain-containing protein [Bradyrhizobium jicamae]